MKKKISLSLFVLFIFVHTSAQKPVKHSIGFSFGVSGLDIIKINTSQNNTGTLLFSYYLTDNMAIRTGVFFGKNDTISKSDTTSGFLTALEKKHSQWAVNTGIQKTFGTTTHFAPYLGCDVYAGGSNGSSDVKITIVSEKGGKNINDFNQTKTSGLGKGFFWGINGIAGFHYFFAEHIGLAAEFGYGFKSATTSSGTSINYIKNKGTELSPTYSATPEKTTVNTIGINGSGLFSVFVFF